MLNNVRSIGLSCTRWSFCRSQYLWEEKDAHNNAYSYVVLIYFVTLHKHAHVCWRLPVFVYLIRLCKSFISYIYALKHCTCDIYKKVTTCILHDTPCHLVIISYLVYFTVVSGHPPQDVDIMWIISVSNVFCLLLVRPLSMSILIVIHS